MQILTNNIVVSLFAYCAGFLFGLGTFYIVGLNGMMLGAIFMFCRQHGMDDELLHIHRRPRVRGAVGDGAVRRRRRRGG